MRNRNNNKNQPFVRLRRRFRLVYLRLLRINDPPERIARGAALGMAMGILPTFGAGTVLSFAFAFVLRANKAAAILGSLIMNPLTQPFFWTASIILGALILGEDSASILEEMKDEGMLRGLTQASVVYLAGNLVITGVVSVGAYFLIKAGIISHRRRKAARRERKRREMYGDQG